ncbi:hypothetical protein [Listeria seeligeri]|uniref:hypothetical protein n=1 Tax=Listeria seeligeri TaxID=1640 RepID=UPI001623C320|nr:hypothetical protein [Listeria seeligeri]MBC1471008.1 hypothetical protein [Listeria seeligeri]
MSQTVITYLILVLAGGYAISTIVSLVRTRRNGGEVVFRPLRLIAAIIVFLLAIFAVVTNTTYDELISKVEDLLQ